MELYTNVKFEAADIEKITGIKRPLLQQWLDKGIIAPSIQVSSGPGTRNVYSVEDVYKIAAIKKINEFGLTREKAATLVNSIGGRLVDGIFRGVGGNKSQAILFLIHNFEGQNFPSGLISQGSVVRENFEEFRKKALPMGGGYFFNYTKLIEEVNAKIRQLA